jgi:hypothetical protein
MSMDFRKIMIRSGLRDQMELRDPITPKSIFINRRRFLAGIPAALLAASRAKAANKFPALRPSPYSTTEKQSTVQEITT